MYHDAIVVHIVRACASASYVTVCTGPILVQITGCRVEISRVFVYRDGCTFNQACFYTQAQTAKYERHDVASR
jgi:hypothetical protein